jgi:hypothetical protein
MSCLFKSLVIIFLFSLLTLLITVDPAVSQQPDSSPPKADDHHKRWICTEISKTVDLLLYDNPAGHGSTASCSYTDDWLLIKPKEELGTDRMLRFVFLAFTAAGSLRNNDFIMPPKVYVGFADNCQTLKIKDVAALQEAAKYYGDFGMLSARAMAKEAPNAACPK